MDLRPVLLEELGLVSALRWYVDDFSKRTGIETSVQLKGIKRIERQRELLIYRIVQECLTNVIKHSEATKAKIFLSKIRGHIKIIIQDNGKGFDPENAIKVGNKGGLGFLGMRERLRLAHGKLNIESKPGKGSKISVIIEP